ncbi:MAG: FAD-dependent oxidoreductase [Candidatus ainarchaeum sp.]|nr:FAD-dependent oxidoreductase [Candidatus ainarchaeum sp.]
MKIGILGGGLSGLALGALLAGEGRHDFQVLEAEAECGGLCRSMQAQGYTFDYSGAHIIFSRKKPVLGLMLSLLGKNACQRRRNTKIFYDGRLVKYPFENGLSGLPLAENLECLAGYASALAQKRTGAKNLKEWLYSRFGKGISEKYLVPYNEKIWNTKAENLSTSWVEGRIPSPPFADVLKASLGLGSEGYTHQLNFNYPLRGGIQSLTRALESRIKGKRIARNFKVAKVKKEGGKWVVSGAGTRAKTEHEFDFLVSTIPIHSLAAAAERVPEEVRTAVSGLKFNSVATVMLGINKPKINDVSWMYFPGSELFNRVAFPSNFSPFAAPEGKSSLVAEITFREGDKVARMSDEKLEAQVIQELAEDKIINGGSVAYSAVKRTRHAYILHDLHYDSNAAAARGHFAKQGIMLCGRFSEFRYLNMDACIESAMGKAAELNSVRGGRND